jgi:hypothetical protein
MTFARAFLVLLVACYNEPSGAHPDSPSGTHPVVNCPKGMAYDHGPERCVELFEAHAQPVDYPLLERPAGETGPGTFCTTGRDSPLEGDFCCGYDAVQVFTEGQWRIKETCSSGTGCSLDPPGCRSNVADFE